MIDYLHDVLSRYEVNPSLDRENIQLEELVVIWHHSYVSKEFGREVRKIMLGRETVLSFVVGNVKIAMKKGARVEVALDVAGEMGHLEIVKFLVEEADPYVQGRLTKIINGGTWK
jgi:hypothetical protein